MWDEIKNFPINAMSDTQKENFRKLNRVGILSLGCPRNLVDSEDILARLREKGYAIVDICEADVAIINTCAFIKEAKEESIDAILDLIDLKKQGKLKKVIVYGCLSQRYKQHLIKELPEIDAFVGIVSLSFSRKRFPLCAGHYAYLKICEGCVNYCSFCIIPRIKKRFISLDQKAILEKVKLFDKDKIKELNIIGQDIGSYGMDLSGLRQLPALIETILQETKHIAWLRLLYLYPNLKVIERLLDLMKNERRVCKYVDLPVQHINDRILKAMNRRTTKSQIIKIVERIRKKVPDAAIRTSLIVGFPSEEEREFEELLEFIEDVKFERLGVFIYSPEEGTPAYSFKRRVPLAVKKARFNTIMARQQEISRELNKRMLGRTMDVLIDEKEKDVYLGRTAHDAPEVDGLVYVDSKHNLEPGDFVKVKIKDTLEYDLAGTVQ